MKRALSLKLNTMIYMFTKLHGCAHIFLLFFSTFMTNQKNKPANEQAAGWQEVATAISQLTSALEDVEKDIGVIKEESKTTQASHQKLFETIKTQQKHVKDHEGSMERKIDQPTYKAFNKKKQRMEERKKQFSIPLFMWLVEEYQRGEKLPELPLSEIRSRVRHGTILHVSIIARFKQKKKIDSSVNWSDPVIKPYYRTLFIRLEKEVNLYIPLGACIRFWGARVILAKHWSNIQRTITNKQLTQVQGKSIQNPKDSC